MTVICGGGTSGPRSGLATNVVYTAQQALGFLPLGLAWLSDSVLYGLGLDSIDTPTFCAIDPPADPGFDGLDALAIATAAPEFERPGARDRLRQLVRRFAWYQLCTCTSVTTPLPPTPPTAPSGLPSINPGGYIPNAALPCGQVAWSIAADTAHQQVFSQYFSMPAGATLLHFETGAWSGGAAFASCNGMSVVLKEYDAAGAFLRNLSASSAWPGNVTYDIAPLTTTSQFRFEMNIPPTCARAAGAGTVDIYCNNQTPGGTGSGSPCVSCPPDPILTGQLSQILQTVNLLQRQLAPFAYVSGAVHSGLTGTGTLAVQGILGLLANISVPSSTSLLPGTPPVRIPLGRLNLATSSGYADRVELVTDSQVILPPLASIFTVVGYTLEPGVTMTLTELVRES